MSKSIILTSILFLFLSFQAISQTKMYFSKGNNMSAVSFLESGSILAFTSDDVEINGEVLGKSGEIRFTKKYMIYPSIINTSNGQAYIDVYWSLGNSNYDCIIDWGDNTLEQFKLVELDYKAYQKKISAKEIEDKKEKEKEILKQKEAEKELAKRKEKEEYELQLVTKKVSSKLDSLMKISEFTKAAELFVEKNGELTLTSYYKVIYDGLVKTYAKDTVYLSDDFTNKFIEKNKDKLKKFAPDNYVLHFGLNCDEKNNLDLKIDKKDLSVKKIGNTSNLKNSFEIPLTTCMKFTVIEEKNKLVNIGMTSSSNKPIYKLDESTFCLKSTGNSKNVSFNYSKDVPKNILRIEKTFESIKRINNTIIFKEVNTTKVEHVVSKKC